MEEIIGKLIIARHHESKWNKLSFWTGITDIELTPHGKKESSKMGETIKNQKIGKAITSNLIRAQQTLEIMLKSMGQKVLIEKTSALNERDYGDYTGKYKWDMKKLLGDEKFHLIRRGWDYPVPRGETLKMVYKRVIPYYLENILPKLKKGENILVVAHMNSLRALIKYIEQIPDDQVDKIEILFGEIFIYQINKEGTMLSKEKIKA